MKETKIKGKTIMAQNSKNIDNNSIENDAGAGLVSIQNKTKNIINNHTANVVGADDPVRLPFEDQTQNKKSSKEYSYLISNLQSLTSATKGITLIALIITIIVMLILVGVTVSIALNGGLIGKVQESAKATEIGMIKDLVFADAGAKQAENEGDEITRSQLREVLEQYFKEVPNLSSMTNEELGEVKLTLKEEYGGYNDIPLTDIYEGVLSIEQVQLASDVLKAGKYVKYNEILWIVLYDKESKYGVQLIPVDKVCTCELGTSDKNADPTEITQSDDAIPLTDEEKKMLSSWSKVPKSINDAVNSYVLENASEIAANVRPFGSKPDFTGVVHETETLKLENPTLTKYGLNERLKPLGLSRSSDDASALEGTHINIVKDRRIWLPSASHSTDYYGGIMLSTICYRVGKVSGSRLLKLKLDTVSFWGIEYTSETSSIGCNPGRRVADCIPAVLLRDTVCVDSGAGTKSDPYLLVP